MKRRHPLLRFGLLAGLLLTACSADPMNVIILSARAPGDKCEFDDDTKYVAGGSLDMRRYIVGTAPNQQTFFTGQYYQVFSWENNNQAIQTSVNGQVVDDGSGNSFIADTVVYDYQYSDPNVAFSSESANLRAVIPAQAETKDSSVPADLIQPGALAAIDASTSLDSGAVQTLLVTFQIFGKLAAGTSQHTNKVSFPLSVYRSAPKNDPLDCPAQGLVISGGVCGIPGRDLPLSCTKP